jgi:hypothetical protein
MFKRHLVLFTTCLVFLLSGFKSKAQWSSEDSLKATNYIRYTAEVFEKLKHNQQVRIAILGITESCAEPVYFASIDSVIKLCYSRDTNLLKDSIDYYLDQLGYNIKYDSIRDFFNSMAFYSRIYQTEEDYNKGVYDSSLVRFEPFVSIINKPAFNNTETLWDVIPLVGYISFEDTFPIISVSPEKDLFNEELLWNEEAPQFSWVFGFRFSPLIGPYTEGLISVCAATDRNIPNNWPPCKECYPILSTAINGLNYDPVGSGLHTEINIKIVKNGTGGSFCNTISNVSGVSTVSNPNGPLREYVLLRTQSRLPIYTFVTSDCQYNYGIKKVKYALLDRLNVDNQNGTYTERLGNAMTLCKDFNTFISGNITNCGQMPGYDQKNRFHMEFGFYRLKRTWESQEIYFYNPYAKGFWWKGNPDYTVNYFALSVSQTPPLQCPGLTNILRKIETGVVACKMCVDGEYTFGNDASKVLVNNDLNIISDYWTDNALDIGFYQFNNNVEPNDYFTLLAGNGNTNSCNTWNPSTLIQTLSLSQTGVYDVQAPINSGSNSTAMINYNANKTFYLTITANFKNGEFISENKCFTINHTCNVITVQIRGDIKDAEEEIVNYEVKIYE